ncbi:MAG: Crp/Fnr family transcriptional regulator [Clostridiales Family XIII bacterium]|nr:Crp/Fnr family transcriptional regulator [Clostridiales Family XIII bacterium]
MCLEIIKKTRLFSGISAEDFDLICTIAVPRIQNFDKNGILWSQGEFVTDIGILISGSILSTKYHIDGRAQILRSYSPLSIINLEAAASVMKTAPTSLIANKKSRLAKIPFEKLVHDVRLSVNLQRILYDNMLGIMADDSIKLMYKSDILSRRTVRDRVLAYLSVVTERRHSNTVDIGMNQDEFAQYLCVDRSSLSLELNEMRREGVLDFSKREYTIAVK